MLDRDLSISKVDDPVEGEGPRIVEAKPRLRQDLEALRELMEPDLPPLRTVRSRKAMNVYYGFGDASGSAFGVTFCEEKGSYFEYGEWTTTEVEQSSNWRELCNLVEALEG